MIERALLEKTIQAGHQGFWQRFLTGGLRAHFRIARFLGLTDTDEHQRIPYIIESGDHPLREQVTRLIRLGFDQALGMTQSDYRSGMPDFEPQPESFKNRFDLPVMVDPRVNIRDQLDRYKIISHLQKADLARFILSESQRADIPRDPYVIWVNMGPPRHSKRIEELDWDETGLTVTEGLAVIREIPYALTKLGTSYMRLGNSVISKKTGLWSLKFKHPQRAVRHAANLGEQIVVDTGKIILELESYDDFDYHINITRGKFI